MKRLRNVMRQELSVFAESPSFVQHEGKKLYHNTLDNSKSIKEIGYQVAKAEYVIQYSKVPDMTIEDVFDVIDEQAKSIGIQQAKYHFEVISKTVEETGNIVTTEKGQPPTPELFLEVMEKIAIKFNKKGEPSMPTMVVGQSGSEAWKKVIKDADTPEFKARFEEVMKKKKEEYDAEQASRKLVD